MRPVHWVSLGLFLSSLGRMFLTLPNWDVVLHPRFVASLLIMMSGYIVAAASNAPAPDTRTGAITDATKAKVMEILQRMATRMSTPPSPPSKN